MKDLLESLGKFFTTDWFFAVPMTILMFVAFALVIWRILLNQGANSSIDAILPDLQANLKKKGPKAAIALCQQEKGLIPSVLYVAGLQASEQGVAAMRRSMASAVELEILPRLNLLLPSILGIAKIATMVGLLGTVLSMVMTFSAIGAASEKGAAGAAGMTAQSEKIGLALYATAFGLFTAIPLVYMHVMFKASIAKQEVKMKLAAQNLISLVQNIKNNPNEPDEENDRDADDDDRRTRRRSAAR
jgi:biopolymer transport protein ExbB